jgi:uncharacterized protein (DUF1778 family)
MNKRVALNIRCTNEWKKQVEEAAKRRGTTVSAYIKNALFEQMKKDNK